MARLLGFLLEKKGGNGSRGGMIRWKRDTEREKKYIYIYIDKRAYRKKGGVKKKKKNEREKRKGEIKERAEEKKSLEEEKFFFFAALFKVKTSLPSF